MLLVDTIAESSLGLFESSYFVVVVVVFIERHVIKRLKFLLLFSSRMALFMKLFFMMENSKRRLPS